MKKNKRIRVLHLISGDLWAGAEAQAEILLSGLQRNPELELSAIILNEGKLSQKLKSLGIRVYVLDEKKHSSLSLFRKVTQILSKNRVQILHTHRYKENVIGGLAALFSGVPHLVKTVHGSAEPFRGIKTSMTFWTDGRQDFCLTRSSWSLLTWPKVSKKDSMVSQPCASVIAWT
jgi:hypothetical protein